MISISQIFTLFSQNGISLFWGTKLSFRDEIKYKAEQYFMIPLNIEINIKLTAVNECKNRFMQNSTHLQVANDDFYC